MEQQRSAESALQSAPMMLLIGMKMSFTKKPMKPMIAKPIDVACAILENSAHREQHRRSLRTRQKKREVLQR